MVWTRQKRRFHLGTFAIAYVAFASMRVSGSRGSGALALVLLPLLLGLVWSRTKPPERGEDAVEPVVRSAARASFFGGAMLLAARTADTFEPALEAAASLGAGISATAALVALARISTPGGSLPVQPAARKLDAAWILALPWAFAFLLALAAVVAPELEISARSLEHATLIAGFGSFVVSTFAAARAHRRRRLELGTGDRTRAVLTVLMLALLIAAAAALLDLSTASQAFEAGIVASAIVTVSTCLARDSIRVARTHRVLVAVAVAGAPLTLFTASLARSAPLLAPWAVLATAVGGIAIGLLAHKLIQPIERDRARWLEAIERAHAAALDPIPDRAIRGALLELRAAAGQPELPPTLFRLLPGEALHVDHAGYLHVRRERVPLAVLEAALVEPERTLRTEVLEALEVRRPDLRPALTWMRAQEAFSATLLRHDEDETAGLLVMPSGRRTTPLMLEEARALRNLADRLASSFEVSSALSRARDRELEERARADAEDDRARKLEYLLTTAGARYGTDARRLARPALAAAYSPSSRLVLDELARLGALEMPVALRVPLGIGPLPFAAVAHLAGPRKDGPLVVVDGANPAEQPASIWHDPKASPLAIADGGTLVVESVEALPHETQRFLALSLATRRSPSGSATPLDLGLVVTVIDDMEALVASSRLTPELADRLGARTLALPALVDRPEDLRALVLDRLALIGVRLRGRAMGIDARGMAELVEHTWPGNEQELADVLTRAALVAEGEVVKAADLERIGFRRQAREG